jgi:hypothetical protein
MLSYSDSIFKFCSWRTTVLRRPPVQLAKLGGKHATSRNYNLSLIYHILLLQCRESGCGCPTVKVVYDSVRAPYSMCLLLPVFESYATSLNPTQKLITTNNCFAFRSTTLLLAFSVCNSNYELQH